jgi:hypothetical protein
MRNELFLDLQKEPERAPIEDRILIFKATLKPDVPKKIAAPLLRHLMDRVIMMNTANMLRLMGMMYASCGLLLILFRARWADSSRTRIEAIHAPAALKTALIKLNSRCVLLLIGSIMLAWGIVLSIVIPLGLE